MKQISLKELKQKLGVFVDVENAPSKNGQNEAPNQFIMTFENGTVLKSYDAYVAAIIDGQTYIGTEHDYSATTNRFVGQFLGMKLADRLKALDNETATLFESY